MSTPLTPEEQGEYTRHIDRFLNTCDLSIVTRKMIRQALQDATNKDLSSQKEAIKSLIDARFDAISKSKADVPSQSETETNSQSPPDQADASDDLDPKEEADVDDDEGGGGIEVSTDPPKKKVKRESRRESSTEDADARLAAELQAQEEKLARGRTTRGGAKPQTTKKVKPKSKSAAKVKKSPKRVRDEGGSDVSDVESGAEKPKRKAGGGFQKPFNLSQPLAELCGEPQLSRPQVVKKLWEHIKGKDLQDPSNRRQILCDDAMQAVFKLAKVDMFQMNKLVGKHLYPVEDGEGAVAVP